MAKTQKQRGRDSAANILRILKATMKNTQTLTEEQELYLKKVQSQIEEGGLPKQTTKNTLKALDALRDELVNPFRVLAILHTHIPERLLQHRKGTGKTLNEEFENLDGTLGFFWLED